MQVINGVDGKVQGTGRLATFTFGDVRASAVRDLLASLGYKGGPQDPGAHAALTNAAEQFQYRWNKAGGLARGEAVFARKLTGGRVEVLSERVGGDGAGVREVVAVATLDGNVTGREDVCVLWRKLHRYYSEHVTSSVIGQWADFWVRDTFAALPMAARGHSVHVTAAHAPAFDRWLAGMSGICEAQTMTFATHDADPASLVSIIAAMRAQVSAAIEKELAKLSQDKLTVRGRDNAVARLRECRDRLAAYRELAGAEVDELSAAVQQAEVDLMLAVFA